MHGPLNVKIWNKLPLSFFITCVYIVRIVESGEAYTLNTSKMEHEHSFEPPYSSISLHLSFSCNQLFRNTAREISS
jgi:hypothetical protein